MKKEAVFEPNIQTNLDDMYVFWTFLTIIHGNTLCPNGQCHVINICEEKQKPDYHKSFSRQKISMKWDEERGGESYSNIVY